MNEYRRIVVPFDGSGTAMKALVAGLNIARDGGGEVLILHVVDALAYMTGFEASAQVYTLARDGAERVLAEAAEVAAAAGVAAQTRLVDEPGERLGERVAREAQAWGADLVVVGTHGRRGIKRVLLGSGAEEIIRMSALPVLTIRDAPDGQAEV